LRAAVNSSGLEAQPRAFIEAAIKRATSYNSFRNRLAHGEFTMDGLIIEGKHHEHQVAREDAITPEMMGIAAMNFRALADFLWKARDVDLGFEFEDEPDLSLESCLLQVNELPSTADSSTKGQKHK
jgi:hypothetical protein